MHPCLHHWLLQHLSVSGHVATQPYVNAVCFTSCASLKCYLLSVTIISPGVLKPWPRTDRCQGQCRLNTPGLHCRTTRQLCCAASHDSQGQGQRWFGRFTTACLPCDGFSLGRLMPDALLAKACRGHVHSVQRRQAASAEGKWLTTPEALPQVEKGNDNTCTSMP